MNRVWLILVWMLSALAVAAGERLNVVLLYADDWRHDTLGAAGNAIVQTPHLDRLAAEGVRFTHGAVTTAICGVSRASLLTGQWMSRHGQRDFGKFATPWSDTLPARLQAAGYQVAYVGKWHSGKFPAEAYDFGRSYSGEHWITPDRGPKVHVTAQNQSDALEFLRTRDVSKPFFLQVAFFAPHAEDQHPQQYLPQPQSFELYENVRMPVPENMTAESVARLPEFLSSPGNEGRNRFTWRFDKPGKYQVMMRNYFRLVSEVDATCGAVLGELDRLGLRENTLVIFTADNGYLHGEHGLADKWYPFDESIRVPLIIRDPRTPQGAGAVRDEWALNVDLAPTMLAAAGVVAPAGVQGTDLAPLYSGKTDAGATWREDFFYEHPTIRGVDFIPSSEALVTRDWKYVRWPDFAREQLFQLSSDPREENDLMADPAHADRLREMRARFNHLKSQSR